MNAVSLKLPEFWESQPSAWFAQTEAQFALRDITADTTKYYYIVAALNSATAGRVVSILENPPEHDKYGALKDHLFKAFGLSDSERARRLLSLNGLGDCKPSELMDKMLSLLGSHKPEFLFKELFLQQLPTQVRSALANTSITDCRALAEEADKFFLAGQQSCAAAWDSPGDGPWRHGAAAVKRQQGSHLCFYHARYGSKAKRCCPPCSYSRMGNGSAGAPLAAMSAGRTCRLLFIQDSISGRRFLCDTGAQKSVLPDFRRCPWRGAVFWGPTFQLGLYNSQSYCSPARGRFYVRLWAVSMAWS